MYNSIIAFLYTGNYAQKIENMNMGTENLATQLLECVDNQDTEAFLAFLTDNVLFRFGNQETVYGKTAVAEVVNSFFASIKGVQHELVREWDEEGAVICHGSVTYTRHDSTFLIVPFANILILDNKLINEYLIFVDTSELYGSNKA